MRVLTDDTKDHVARYYNYIVNNNLLEKYEIPQAVQLAINALEGGYSVLQTKFIEKFIEQFDDVRQIWEEQPKYEITINYRNKIGPDEIPVEIEPYVETLSTYSKVKLEDRINHLKWKERAYLKTITYKLQ